MRLSFGLLAVPAVIASFVLTAFEKDASAQVYVVRRGPYQSSTGLNLGLDVEGASDVTPPDNTSVAGGGGVKLRIGAEIHRPYLRIIPEGGFAFTHLFVQDTAGDSLGWNMERLFVGCRIGFGEVIVPIIYGHIGYGWRASDDISTANGFPAANGLTADGGVGLDFHFIRHLGLGLHAEYVTVQSAPAVPDWIAVGGHMDYRF
jgi:hypothetical protein